MKKTTNRLSVSQLLNFENTDSEKQRNEDADSNKIHSSHYPSVTLSEESPESSVSLNDSRSETPSYQNPARTSPLVFKHYTGLPSIAKDSTQRFISDSNIYHHIPSLNPLSTTSSTTCVPKSVSKIPLPASFPVSDTYRTGAIRNHQATSSAPAYRYCPYPQSLFLQNVPTLTPSPTPPSSSSFSVNPFSLSPHESIVYGVLCHTYNPTNKTSPSRSSQDYSLWKRQRRTRACLRCHIKKIKCEGDGPVCANCTRNGVECQYVQAKKRGPKPKVEKYTSSDRKTEPTSVLLRPPTPTAITTDPNKDANTQKPLPDFLSTTNLSRVTIAKLTSETASDDFPRILLNQRSSELETRSKHKSPHLASPEQLQRPITNSTFRSSTDELMAEFSKVDFETREAVIYFFDYQYALSPIFHPAGFFRRISKGDVDQLLIDAIKASTARIITKKTGRLVDVKKMIRNVNERLLTYNATPTIDYIRAIVIMSTVASAENDFISFNSLSSLGMSSIIRLGWHTQDLNKQPKDISWKDWVELEIKRRTFWLAYQNDGSQAMISDRPTSLLNDRCYVFEPMSDGDWHDISIPVADDWPQKYSKNMSHEEIVTTGALTCTFRLVSEIIKIVSRINTFLWDIRVAEAHSKNKHKYDRERDHQLLEPQAHSKAVNTIDRSRPLSSNPTFIDLKKCLDSFKSKLLCPKIFDGNSKPLKDISEFGNPDHRRFMMKTRYFCLFCYFTPFYIYLYQADRPSFYSNTSNKSYYCDLCSSIEDDVEDTALRDLLRMSFADSWNDALLSCDINQQSWDACLELVYEFSEFLKDNADMPLERFDQIVPICLFVTMTVLVRHIKRSRRKLSCTHIILEGGEHGRMKLASDISKCGVILKQFMSLLKNLGLVWGTKSIEELLNTMQIEEVANTSDLLSGLML